MKKRIHPACLPFFKTKFGVFCHSRGNGYYWFRIFGYGCLFKDLNKYNLLFSERNGFRKYIRIGNWCISFLKKSFTSA